MNYFELWLIVDENGDHAVGTSRDQAQENYDTEIGAGEGMALRFIRVPVHCNLPKPLALAAVMVPDEE